MPIILLFYFVNSNYSILNIFINRSMVRKYNIKILIIIRSFLVKPAKNKLKIFCLKLKLIVINTSYNLFLQDNKLLVLIVQFVRIDTSTMHNKLKQLTTITVIIIKMKQQQII